MPIDTGDPQRTPSAAQDTIDRDGWLGSAMRRPSPHRDPRPEGTQIDLLVIHNISLPPGELGGAWIDDLFLGRLDPAAHPYFEVACAAGPVSTHLLIRRDERFDIEYAGGDSSERASRSQLCQVIQPRMEEILELVKPEFYYHRWEDA